MFSRAARFHAVLGFIGIFLVAPVMPGQNSSETTVIASACKLESNQYTCNLPSFQQTLSKAKTAAIQTGPVDPAAQKQLKTLIDELKLSAPVPGEPADLTFLLVPVDPQSVEFSPGDTQVAALHVFAHGSGPGRGDLVWAEHFIGPEDIPWPIVVNRLILQFRTRFHIPEASKKK